MSYVWYWQSFVWACEGCQENPKNNYGPKGPEKVSDRPAADKRKADEEAKAAEDPKEDPKVVPDQMEEDEGLKKQEEADVERVRHTMLSSKTVQP